VQCRENSAWGTDAPQPRGAVHGSRAAATGAPPRPQAGRLIVCQHCSTSGAGSTPGHDKTPTRDVLARGERDAGADQLLPPDPPDVPDPPAPLGPPPRGPVVRSSGTCQFRLMRSIGNASSTDGWSRVEHVSSLRRPRPGALGLWRVNVQRVPRRGVVGVARSERARPGRQGLDQLAERLRLGDRSPVTALAVRDPSRRRPACSRSA
jgi:hypothetical protein